MDNYDEMLVLLLANVATQYVEIRTLAKTPGTGREKRGLAGAVGGQPIEKRYKTGIANAYPGYYQLLSNLENTKALIPQLDILLRQANNQFCILLGEPVHDMLPRAGRRHRARPGPSRPANGPHSTAVDEKVVVGIPAELLLVRPDVKAAEEQMRIQSAQIGIAEAELYPHIGINGSIGLAAEQIRHAVQHGARGPAALGRR